MITRFFKKNDGKVLHESTLGIPHFLEVGDEVVFPSKGLRHTKYVLGS